MFRLCKEELALQKRSLGTLLLILGIIATLFAVMTSLPPAEQTHEAEIAVLADGWYTLEDGVRKSVTLPMAVRHGRGEALVLYNDSLTQADAGKMLTTRGVRFGLRVALDGELLYEYTDESFPRNDQMKAKVDCDIQLPVDRTIGVLEVTYREEKAGEYVVAQFLIGSGSAVMWRHLMDSAMTIGIAFLFVVLSVIATGIAIYLHFARLEKKRFFDTAAFLFIGSVWFVTDSFLVQIQAPNPAAVCVVSFYAFMLLAVPMLYFIKHTADLGKYRVLDVLLGLFYVNAIAQGVLHQTLGIDFRDMLFVTHLLLVAGVGITSLLLGREYAQNRTRQIGMVLAAYVILGSSGILSLALYWILEIPYYGAIFEIGILLFVLIIIASIVMSMVENVHYRTEMQVYQRMMREDWMTGMANRLPFEDCLKEIQSNPVRYKNAALIFLRVNQLRITNDESGHAAGDKLILGAAKCISETFGKAGHCYRLEGDEFCVILEERGEGRDAWFKRLDLEIRKYNRNNSHWLSIARGWSDLSNEDGSWKTISDWKYDANSQLCRNKG